MKEIKKKDYSHKLYFGDNIELMKTFGDECVDLTVTSPPYDTLRTYDDSLKWDFDVFKEVADELYRLTKQGGIVVWVVGDKTQNGSETGTSFRQALYFKEIGFNIHDTMIYRKDNPPPVGGSNRYYQHFEYMFVFSKGKPKTFNPIIAPRRNKHNDQRTQRVKGFTRNSNEDFDKKVYHIKEEVKQGNIWSYVVGGGNSTSDGEAFKHPATFPEKLAEDHILSWSNKGDVVFDPFMGSGTTNKLAYVHDRNSIGTEKVEKYYDIAYNRLDGLAKTELPSNLFGDIED